MRKHRIIIGNVVAALATYVCWMATTFPIIIRSDNVRVLDGGGAACGHDGWFLQYVVVRRDARARFQRCLQHVPACGRHHVMSATVSLKTCQNGLVMPSAYAEPHRIASRDDRDIVSSKLIKFDPKKQNQKKKRSAALLNGRSFFFWFCFFGSMLACPHC